MLVRWQSNTQNYCLFHWIYSEVLFKLKKDIMKKSLLEKCAFHITANLFLIRIHILIKLGMQYICLMRGILSDENNKIIIIETEPSEKHVTLP